MDRKWSTYIQTSEELYLSRSLRFREDNILDWIKVLELNNNMNILEVGCGSGTLGHMIKKSLPNIKMTGIDYDLGHIEYARNKAKQLSLDCTYVNADALKLPFNDNTFDCTYSHTVIDFCDPEKFIEEQYRVLNHGGKLKIIFIIHVTNTVDSCVPIEDGKEKYLFNKLWAEASKNDYSHIKKYSCSVKEVCSILEKSGFININIKPYAILKYGLDFSDISHKFAIDQINENRIAELSSINKAKILAPNGLTEIQYNDLIDLVNERFDKQLKDYEKGIKTWDYHIQTSLILSGEKK